MTKKKVISKIFGIGLVFAMVGSMFGGLASIDSIFASPGSHGKDNIISDVEYRDYQSMSLADIQIFLENPRWGDGYLGRASYLATYTTMDYQGVERSAAEIIYNVARDYLSQGYQISPEVILTTLQKEQSLITASSPSDYALDWAMGYAVGNDDWKGFGKQVDAGGWQLGYDYKYIETHGSKNGWGPGISKQTLDGVTVTPENIATACLYDYTPHAGAGWGGSGGGNYLFWDVYYNYFHFGDEEDTTPPTVDAFSVTPYSLILGNAFTISYTVSDTGGSGLNRAELWRKDEGIDWREINRTYISGNTYSGSFFDEPTSTGTYWYGLHVVDNAGNWAPEDSPIQVEVIQSPQIELTPSSHSFGNVQVGQCSSEYSFTLTNTGGGTATGSVSLTGTHASQFTIMQGSGSFSLGTGASKIIRVKFCPTSTGAKSATLYADGTNCNDDTSSLSGTGVSAPQIGSLTVSMYPTEVRGEARWRLTSGPDTGWKQHGEMISNIPTGSYTLQFKDVTDWNKPSDKLITINTGANSESGTYIPETQNTGWKSPKAHGRIDNEWSNPENAYSSNNQYAVAGGWYSDQDWYNFGFNIPSGSVIDGIEIKLEGTGDGIEYVGKVKCRVFWGPIALDETDYLEFPATEDAFCTVGGSSDLWGGSTWSAENFEDDAAIPFAVRLTTADWHTCRLDHIQVKVYYTEVSIQPPQITTNSATNVEETTATLNGVITDDGGEACQYRFEYDINSGEPYAYNTSWTGSKTSGQSFNAAIPSLNKGAKYYFRAQGKNSGGTDSGSELTFLTKPDGPSSFSATVAGTSQIDLSWSKGAGAQKTKIQRKQGSYPVDRNDGTQVYFDTGTSEPDIGLTPDTTYYYRAWSYVQGSEQWSDNSAQDSATTAAINQYSLTISSTSGGSVSVPGEGVYGPYDHGTVVDLIADPDTNSTFVDWTGDVGTIDDINSANTNITMDGNKTVTATFVVFTAPANVDVTAADPGIESIDVSSVELSEVNTTNVPEDVEAQEAYVVDSTGTGNFTLSFTGIANAESIVVYKVTDSDWLQLTAAGSGTTLEVTIPAGDPPVVFCTPTGAPPPVGGTVYPVNKLAILAPWIALAVLLAGGLSWLTLRRHRAQS